MVKDRVITTAVNSTRADNSDTDDKTLTFPLLSNKTTKLISKPSKTFAYLLICLLIFFLFHEFFQENNQMVQYHD